MPDYTQSPSLNDKGYNLNNQQWQPIGPAFKIVKLRGYTPIELEYSGECLAGSISNGFGIRFQIRIDGKLPDYESQGTLKATDRQAEISTKSVYVGLPAGTYEAQMYAVAANAGSSAQNVVLDPGGWGERILVTEF
ncbi:hypothetical protein XV92_18205 [Vibrio metoecus]|uniref:Uncharacterized protein n=1 Tax=Vibrio metoecus TaxID=1481663 RepID=A0A0Q0YLN3_VIBMT|nr:MULTISPECIES: hypothetical protein [Vibrio]KQA96351.1 hypothetical protein XV92_18205 [Vibrio metoecus]RBM46508.1 hypothetical protein DLR64_17585 [Vibrio tarriae]